MMNNTSDRKIVIVNQAVNYLTIGFCNAFNQRFDNVSLITGSIHVQGEELDPDIEVTKLNQWAERPVWKKMASYLLACFKIWILLLTKYRNHEVFFVSIPPMGYLLNIILPHRFSILIWDVYPDIFKVTGMKENHPLYRIWAALNRRSFRKAYRLFTIGETMKGLVCQYVDREKVVVTPIWSIFQENESIPKEENPFIEEHGLQGKFIVQYSGNIGLTHNVEVMIDLAKKLQHKEDILFQIIGRGPRKPHLEKLVKEKNLPNCMFLPFQSDELFPKSLSAADLGVVILDEATSKGSVPSKSYNLMSFGIPSLYIASQESELHSYAMRYNHAECFGHDDLEGAVTFIEKLDDNKREWNWYSEKAEEASKNYRRVNADLLVEKYLKEEHSVSQRNAQSHTVKKNSVLHCAITPCNSVKQHFGTCDLKRT